MKSYSIDLRQKIINVYETEPISQKTIAKRFCLALSFVKNCSNNTVKPKTFHLKLIDVLDNLNLPEQLVILAELIEAPDDATLEELGKLLHEKISVTISRATMGRMTQRLNMTFKKNALSLGQRQRQSSKPSSPVLVASK